MSGCGYILLKRVSLYRSVGVTAYVSVRAVGGVQSFFIGVWFMQMSVLFRTVLLGLLACTLVLKLVCECDTCVITGVILCVASCVSTCTVSLCVCLFVLMLSDCMPTSECVLAFVSAKCMSASVCVLILIWAFAQM